MSTSSEKPPYVTTPGTLAKALGRLKQAATPPRFTQDFVKSKLLLKGGNAAMVIPYLKKIGFLASDGTPTDIYARFRNPSESGRAMAAALRNGYKSLFEINEKAHQLKDEELKGLIVQVTGQTKGDTVTKLIFACFKILKERAAFEREGALIPHPQKEAGEEDDETSAAAPAPPAVPQAGGIGMNLSYTINLNLPATTDIAVFNAIFQSLRRNLLRNE